jgi:hypothetical protein
MQPVIGSRDHCGPRSTHWKGLIMARKAVSILLLGAALWCVRPLSAQEVDKGDQVYATRQADLKIEDEVIATTQPDEELLVHEVSGKWLWVETADGERGWIDRQFVTIEAPAPRPPVSQTPPVRPTVTATPSAIPVPTPVTPTPETAASDVEEKLLLAVGALSGQNVYITYAYIGTVADGFANQVYTADQVRELMSEVKGLCSVAGEYMRTLADSKISTDDRATIEQMVGIFQLLRQEADALSSFAQSESQADLDAYEAARKDAWPRIQTALGIE